MVLALDFGARSVSRSVSRYLPVLLIVVIGFTMGCATSPLDDDRLGAEHPAFDPDALEANISEPNGDADVSAASKSVELPANAGPQDYVDLALKRHPAIRMAKQKIARLRQKAPQVTSLDDPMFQIAPAGEFAETAAGQVELMTGVSQKLPFPGKLEARGRLANQDVTVGLASLHQVRLNAAAQTRRAFWNYYYTVRAIEVTANHHSLLKQFRQVAEARFKAGTASQQDVLRASVELSNVDNRLIQFKQRRVSAVAMLNTMINRPVSAPLPEPAVVRFDHLKLDADALTGSASRLNPEIQIAKAQIGSYRLRSKLAELNRWPDLTVGAHYTAVDDTGLSPASNGDDQWWFSFGVNLPIWTGKRDAAQREAHHGMLESIAGLNQTALQVRFAVKDAVVRVQSDQDLVILFRDTIIPQAKLTVDSSLSSYQAGKSDFLSLIDNWRRLLDFQLTFHKNLVQLEQDFALLEQVVGKNISRQSESAKDTSKDTRSSDPKNTKPSP
jgi:cobalt-zinc-cadmium efflux system outer membrane protein